MLQFNQSLNNSIYLSAVNRYLHQNIFGIISNKPKLLLSTGRYCIYKKGWCPKGMKKGHVFWDDDNTNNSNAKGGTLPGKITEYTVNTEIRFCCRIDGEINDPVLLPSKTPFFLLAYGSAECQMVKWAIASLEWIFFDTENDQNNDRAGGAYPFEAGINHPTIYYCYYRGKLILRYFLSFPFHLACIYFVFNDKAIFPLKSHTNFASKKLLMSKA